MGYGKTNEMRAFSLYHKVPTLAWEQKDRDRSLPGKKRIKARKAKNN